MQEKLTVIDSKRVGTQTAFLNELENWANAHKTCESL